MKKQIIFLGVLLVTAFGFSQNVFNTGAGTFVGIGTTSPTVKLDVITTAKFGAFSDLAFFGNRYILGKHCGLFLKQSNISDSTFKLQYGVADIAGMNNKGFVEFNTTATTNTTISAVSFGSNGSEFMRINQDGKVRIANGANDLPTPNGYRLFVEEGILTEKVKVAVKTTSNWADFVFNEDYKLMPLNEVESFLLKNKHLPNVPSAIEMVENGLDVAQMDAKLLEKVEELTLYIIAQNKQIEELKAAVQTLMEKK